MRIPAITVMAAMAALSVQAVVWDFDLFMSGSQEAPTPNASPATGGELEPFNPAAKITYDTDTQILVLNIGYGADQGYVDLGADLINAHIHVGAAGVAGPVVIGLTDATPNDGANLTQGNGARAHNPNSLRAGTFTGTIDYAALGGTAESDLLAGLHYVNIHTTDFPGGEIRGQLTPVPEPHEYAMIAGLGLLGFALFRRYRTATA